MHDFRKLRVWNDAVRVAVRVYSIARCLPDQERFGLRSQIQRAAASIGANIAEGRLRGSDADFCRFLQYALGSSAEVEHFLELAVRLQLLESQVLTETLPQLTRLRGALIGLIKSIHRSPSKNFPHAQTSQDRESEKTNEPPKPS